MPCSVKDRFTVDFEEVLFFTKNKKYYFEQQFEKNMDTYFGKRGNTLSRNKMLSAMRDKSSKEQMQKYSTQGRNKRCVWNINTKPFKGAHFAVFPEELIIIPIKAGCPENGIVLDPFFGSGTVGVVTKKLNRNFIGIDLNLEYCKIAEKRIK